MVVALRQRHRVIVLVLGVLLPAAFSFGIASRDSVPLLRTQPGIVPDHPVSSFTAAWAREDLWQKSPLRTRLLHNSTSSTSAVEVTGAEVLVKPDLLLYWLPGAQPIQELLPNDAVLLGAWKQEPVKALKVPHAAQGSEGKLLLYSLADQEIVNVTKSFTLQ